MEILDIPALYLGIGALVWVLFTVLFFWKSEWIGAALVTIFFFAQVILDLFLGGVNIPNGQLILILFGPLLLASVALRQDTPVRVVNILPIFLLAVTIVVSIIWNGLPIWDNKTQLMSPIFAILLYLAIPGIREARFLINLFLLFVVISTSVAALQYMGFENMYLPSQRRLSEAGGFQRGIGLANHFWMTGLYCAATIPIAVMGSLTANSRWKRQLYIVTGIFAVAGLTFTSLRAGLIGGVFGTLLALFFWNRATAIRYSVAALVVLGLLFAAVPLLRTSSEALLEHTTTLDASAKRRPELIMQGLEIWRKAPLLGAGPKSMLRTFDVGDTHNSFVNVLADYGLIGETFFLAVVVMSFRSLRRAYRRFPEEKGFILGLTGALAGIYIVSIVHSVNYIELYWMFPALALAIDRSRGQRPGAASGETQASAMKPDIRILMPRSGGIR